MEPVWTNVRKQFYQHPLLALATSPYLPSPVQLAALVYSQVLLASVAPLHPSAPLLQVIRSLLQELGLDSWFSQPLPV